MDATQKGGMSPDGQGRKPQKPPTRRVWDEVEEPERRAVLEAFEAAYDGYKRYGFGSEAQAHAALNWVVVRFDNSDWAGERDVIVRLRKRLNTVFVEELPFRLALGGYSGRVEDISPQDVLDRVRAISPSAYNGLMQSQFRGLRKFHKVFIPKKRPQLQPWLPAFMAFIGVTIWRRTASAALVSRVRAAASASPLKVAGLSVAALGVWMLMRCPGPWAPSDGTARTEDSSPPSGSVASGLSVPGQPSCSGAVKARKECWMREARRIRRLDPAGARRAYEAALALDFPEPLENLEMSLAALLELTSLQVGLKDFNGAWKTYERYIERMPHPFTSSGADCRLRFALASHVLDDGGAIESLRSCGHPARNEPEVPSYTVTKAKAPWCWITLALGAAYEREHRDVDAFFTYAEELDFMQGNAPGARQPHAVGDWANLGCESNSVDDVMRAIAAVGERLERERKLLWIGEDALLSNRLDGVLERISIIGNFRPERFGCWGNGKAIQIATLTRFINGQATTPGFNDSSGLHVGWLRQGTNTIEVETVFPSKADGYDEGCEAETRGLSFCLRGDLLFPWRSCSGKDVWPPPLPNPR